MILLRHFVALWSLCRLCNDTTRAGQVQLLTLPGFLLIGDSFTREDTFLN